MYNRCCVYTGIRSPDWTTLTEEIYMQHAHNAKTFPHYNKTVWVDQSVIKSSHPKCTNVAKPIHTSYNAVVIHASFWLLIFSSRWNQIFLFFQKIYSTPIVKCCYFLEFVIVVEFLTKFPFHSFEQYLKGLVLLFSALTNKTLLVFNNRFSKV